MKRERFTTPVGSFGFPCFIDEPDASYADEEKAHDIGEYKVRVRMDPEDSSHAEFLRFLEEQYDQNLELQLQKAGKKKLKQKDEGRPWMAEVDEDGEETGMILVRAKLTANVSKGDGYWSQKPKVFDPDGHPYVEVPRIGPGSVGQVAGEIHTWYNGGLGVGITLWCQAIKLVSIVEKSAGGSNNPEDYGFAAPAEGFAEAAAGVDDGETDY